MAIRAFLFFILTVLATEGLPQAAFADSVEQVLREIPPGPDRVQVLVHAAETLRERDNNRALSFAHEAVKLADSINDREGLCAALEHYAWMLYRKAKFAESLKASTQALVVSRQIDDKVQEAKSLINIAAIHYEQERFERAIAHFRGAYRVAREVDDWHTMARCHSNIAYTYVGLKKLDSADVYAREALSASTRAGSAYLQAFSMRTLGDICLLRNDPDEALLHFAKCFDLSVRENNTFLKTSVLHRLANTHKTRGENDIAIRYICDNIALAEEYGFDDELERAYKMAADIYHAENELPKAYAYLAKYVALRDTLRKQRAGEQIALMQASFDSEMKETEIELLTKDAERQRAWNYVYATGLLLFVIVALVLFLHNRNSHRANRLLQEKNREIETHSLQLMSVNSTKDKLFSIISHDLRSPVASLRGLMELISKPGVTQVEFQTLTAALKKNLDSVYNDLDNLLLWSQTQLRGLQATPEQIHVRQMVEEKILLFSEAAQQKDIGIDNLIGEDAVVVADRNQVGIILRNLIANAIKFNRPGGSIHFRSRRQGGMFQFSITDTGVGIPQADLQRLFRAETHFTRPGTRKERGTGIGLLLTREFIESNQGQIWVSSEVDKGTTFTFTLRAAQVEAFAGD